MFAMKRRRLSDRALSAPRRSSHDQPTEPRNTYVVRSRTSLARLGTATATGRHTGPASSLSAWTARMARHGDARRRRRKREQKGGAKCTFGRFGRNTRHRTGHFVVTRKHGAVTSAARHGAHTATSSGQTRGSHPGLRGVVSAPAFDVVCRTVRRAKKRVHDNAQPTLQIEVGTHGGKRERPRRRRQNNGANSSFRCAQHGTGTARHTAMHLASAHGLGSRRRRRDRETGERGARQKK